MGLSPNKSSAARRATFGDIVDLHIDDMCTVGKPPRRRKAATLATLKTDLGKERIGVFKMIITHAVAVHGRDISSEPVDLAYIALKRLGLIGKGIERDRSRQ